jgi:hypothetical protein
MNFNPLRDWTQRMGRFTKDRFNNTDLCILDNYIASFGCTNHVKSQCRTRLNKTAKADTPYPANADLQSTSSSDLPCFPVPLGRVLVREASESYITWCGGEWTRQMFRMQIYKTSKTPYVNTLMTYCNLFWSSYFGLKNTSSCVCMYTCHALLLTVHANQAASLE